MSSDGIDRDANPIGRYAKAINEFRKANDATLDEKDYDSINEQLIDMFKDDDDNGEYVMIFIDCLKSNDTSALVKRVVKNMIVSILANKEDKTVCSQIAELGILAIRKELDEFKSNLHQAELQFNAKNEIVSDNSKCKK